ncbi:hypothetical protein [Allokutzneria multivorans]
MREVELKSWREAMEADLRSPMVEVSTRAMLAITNNDPDRIYVEDLLLECISAEFDPQLRALAVTCIGHVARIHRMVSRGVLGKLEELLSDPDLGGIAEDALDDVKSFVGY